jgi:hypothetical protein
MHNSDMKLFIKKILLYSIPILLLAVISEYLLRKVPNDYNTKVEKYKTDATNIRVWILGSSYGLYNLNPAWFELDTYNGSHVLQSLDLDTKIFEKYEGRFSNLQYVIMPVTFASFFYRLEDTRSRFLLKNYAVYYGFSGGLNPANYLEILDQPFSVNRTHLFDYYLKKKSHLKITALGFDSTYHSTEKKTSIDGPTAGEAIERLDMKGISLVDEQKRNLELIIEKCRERKIKLLLFTPPAYEGFYTPADTLHLNTSIRACQEMQDKYDNVRYYNFLGDSSFTIDDFYDYSHLNQFGSKKLSAKFNQILQQ